MSFRRLSLIEAKKIYFHIVFKFHFSDLFLLRVSGKISKELYLIIWKDNNLIFFISKKLKFSWKSLDEIKFPTFRVEYDTWRTSGPKLLWRVKISPGTHIIPHLPHLLNIPCFQTVSFCYRGNCFLLTFLSFQMHRQFI